MKEELLQMILDLQEKYDIPHDQKIVFANDIIDICATYEKKCREKVYEETPAEQVDRENFIPLH